mmetsp:Transcript_47316/g.85263  ORF Transcript_47316/g.85263 Transcript_47316/m.85263 type:complete len:193 (+) Transcript_47316:233-811(+)
MPEPIPKAFTPAGWAAVKTETIKKEQQLSRTSSSVLGGVRERNGGHPVAGWAWFTSAGFCDANDQEKIVRTNFPQRPYFDKQRSAGHDTGEQKGSAMRLRHAASGRGQFLDRTESSNLLGPLAMSRTLPAAGSASAGWPSSPTNGWVSSPNNRQSPHGEAKFNRSHIPAGFFIPPRHLSSVPLRIPGHAEVF